MKANYFLAAISLLLTAQVNFSCKKENSCEGCNETNKPPISIAGPDKVITLPTDSVLLDGSASSDPDGTIGDWLWKKIEGPASFTITNPVSVATKVKNLVTGAYQFELQVKDDKGLSAKDTIRVVVNDPSQPNKPPVANAGSDQTIILPANSVTIDGSASADPDNNITAYAWTKISGPSSFTISNPNAVQTHVTNLVEGVYQFELKVTDAGGLFANDTVQVFVNNPAQPNRPPVANAGADQSISLPVNTSTLDGRASSDPDNNITAYAWTKISGPSSYNISNANAVQTQATNLVQGAYLFELKVTDGAGLFDKDTVQIIVTSQPQPCTDCKIVFVSNRDGNSEIYTYNSAGSITQRLTYDSGIDEQPVWSPDGSRIAFVSNRAGNYELYIMNADGSNVVRKTFFAANYVQNPTWSPDGTKIAYANLGNGSNDIWVIGTASGPPTLLFTAPGYEDQPAWSPDGTKIAIISDWFAYDFVLDIYTINADGIGFTALTGNIFDHLDYIHPSWSPDGTKIALAITDFTTYNPFTYPTQIAVMNSNGSNLTTIISGGAGWSKTSWSGDGSRIAYTRTSGSGTDIAWVKSDGSSWGIIVTNGWNADWK